MQWFHLTAQSVPLHIHFDIGPGLGLRVWDLRGVCLLAETVISKSREVEAIVPLDPHVPAWQLLELKCLMAEALRSHGVALGRMETARCRTDVSHCSVLYARYCSA